MGQFLLLLVVALTVAAVVFGVTVLVTGGDPGLVPAEPDGRAVPLPGSRPLRETDVSSVRFDTAVRGYRMAQVDQAMRRAAYDIGYKDELIGVLEAEVAALREGRVAEADSLRRAREAALVPAGTSASGTAAADGAGPAVPGVTVRAAEPSPVSAATPDAKAAPDPDAVPPTAGVAATGLPDDTHRDGADREDTDRDGAVRGDTHRDGDAAADRPVGSTSTSGPAATAERG